MKKNKFLSKNYSSKNPASAPVFALILLLDLLAASAGFAGVGTDTWSGAGAATATTGWAAPGNWAAGSTNPTPNAGDALVFTGSSGLINGDNIAGALNIGGLTFGSSAGAFTLGATSGDSIALTTTATITDNSSVTESINLPMALGAASQNVNVTSGGSLTINGLISGTGPLVIVGGGVLTLTGQAAGANIYSGGTMINSGTLGLDFSQGGSTPVGGILANGALTLGGGTLTINGGSAATDSQTFSGTTLNPGQSIIAVTNGASGGTATVNLNAITANPGASVVFYGAASSTAGVAATGTIATTTAGQGQTVATQDGTLANGAANNAYATVGLYDWATTDSGATTAGTTVIGGSSIPGFYSVPGNNSNPSATVPPNWDIATQDNPLTFSAATTARLSSTSQYQLETLRFNTGNAPYLDVRGTDYLQTGGLLVTPNLGVINVGVCNVRLANTTCQIVQNNTTGLLIIGIDSTSTSIWQAFTGAAINDTADNVVKSGAGTLVLDPIAGMGFPVNYTNSSGAYTVSTSGRVIVGTYDSVDVANTTPAAFYFNGGVTVINNGNQLGNSTAQGTIAGAVGTVNLNGGTLMGAMSSFSLINAASGSAARPVFLGGNGGGLAAQTTNTFIIPGVISGASGTGPLTIGIPASSANGGNAGLVPGTGSVGGYVTMNPAFNANGTVLLSATNTYTGNTIINSGTLLMGATGSISNSPNIIVGAGANFDVSQVGGGFTLGASQVQNLMGSGSVTGAVVVASGSGIYGGTDGTYGTNTFNSKLTLATGAAAYFDLGTSTTGTNDEIVVNGNLTLNGNVIHLKAPSTTTFLGVGSYTLFSSPNPITVNGTLSLVWDVPPLNLTKYVVTVTANSVLLSYVSGPGPIIASATTSPNPAYPNQTVLISATVLTNGQAISSITVDASQTAGTAPGTTVLPLVLSAAPNVYTNSVWVGASVPANSTTANIITAVDNATPTPNTVHFTNILNIVSGAPTISASVSPNPAGPGQTVTITATVEGHSYPINVGGVTVDVSAIAGTSPGTTILPLNLSSSPSVYTNSYTVLNTTADGAQTLTIKAVDSGSEISTLPLVLTVSPLDVWNGLGPDNNWTTGGNWRSGLAPNTGDFVTFAGSTQLTSDLNNNYSLGSLIFDKTAGAFNITNDGTSTLTLTGSVTNNSANVQILSVPVALGGAQTFSVVSNSIVLSNSVADDVNDSLTGGIVVAGTNTLTLAGNNTYSGTTTINTGSKLTIAGTGQLGGGAYAQIIAINGTLNYNSSAAQTLSGLISGNGIFQIGAGNLTLPTANNYGGGTVINGGVVQAQIVSCFGSGTITNNGGTIQFPSGAAITFANNVWATGTSIIDQNNFSGADAFNGTFGGNGTVIITNLVIPTPAAFSTFTIGGSMAAFSGKIICAPVTSASIPSAGFLRLDSGAIANTGNTNMSVNLGADPSQVILTTPNPETANLGELIGGSATAVEGPRSSAGTTIWSIGGLNTSTTFAGTIEDVDTGTEAAGTKFAALTKVGTGRLTLAGLNTYSGSTTVSSGVLALTNNPDTFTDASIGNSANIFINAGATLDLSGLSAPTLTLNSGQTIGGGGTNNGSISATSGSTINPGSAAATGALTITTNLTESGGVNNQFALSANANPDVISVHGTLDLSSGIQNIIIKPFSGASVLAGTYPLFTYTTLNGGIGNLAIVTNGPYAFTATLTNMTSVIPNQIAVVVIAARPATNLVWTGDGVANNWDLGTTNWTVGGTLFAFESGDKVFFTDSGSTNPAVNLVTTIYPASVLVSNSTAASYTFSGSGSISGSIGLTKTNSGILTIQNVNTYTGPTIFGGGTVSVSSLPNGGIVSPIGAASNNSTNLVFAGGTLAYTGGTASTDRGATLNAGGGTLDVAGGTTLTLGGIIAGSGVLTVTDNGVLNLPIANTYSGGTLINGGIVQIANAASLGTGTVTNKGTILMPSAAALTVANNLWFTSTSIIDQDNYLGSDSFSGTFSGNGTVIITNLAEVSSTTYSTFTIQGSMSSFTGTITVAPDSAYGPTVGFIRFNSGTTVNNTGSAVASFNLGGGDSQVILTERDPSINNLGALTGGPGTALEGSRNAGTATWIIGGLNTSTTFAGTIEDADATEATPAGLIAAITKVGTGTLTLSGANVYSGPTVVSNGVLNITGSLSTGVGGGTLNSVSINGGTLAGSGTINFAVTNYSGGTLAPGAGTNVAGTVLTINANVTLLLGSTNIMEVTHVPSINGNTNDQVVSSGAITYGGTLIITTNAGDATPYQVGNTFTLFNAATYSGSFTSIQPPPGPGLSWTNDSVNLGQFDVISNAVPPAPIAGFSGTLTNIFVTQSVVFTNTSTGSFTNSAWNFGDGHAANLSGASVSNNVSNTFSNAGTYTVQLIVTGAGGSGTNTQVNYIVVKPKVTIGKPVLSGGNLILSGTNGPAGQPYRILSSTNVALNVTNWLPVWTSVFASDGSYSYTNSPLTNKATFFRLVSP